MKRWLLLAALGACGAAWAQELSGAQLAIKRGQEGDRYWSTGRCDAAIDAWTEAEKAFHAPTLVFRIARCQALLGLVVESAANFKAIVDEPLAPDAPASWKEAHEQAASWLPGVEERIAHLQIDPSTLPGDSKLTVQIDGQSFDAGVDVPRNPGRHQVSLTVGKTSLLEPVDLENGGKKSLAVNVALEPAPPPKLWPRRLAWVLGAGGLAIAVSSVLGFGLTAGRLHGELLKDPLCSPPAPLDKKVTCGPTLQPKIDEMRLDSNLSDIGLGVGAALAVAGTVMLIVLPVPVPGEAKVKISATLNALVASGTF